MEIENILHKSSSKRSFTNGIHSELMRERALTSFTLYNSNMRRITHVASLRSGIVIEVKK